ncbi:Peptidase inhibitor family I36 [Amycolatopsis arida]|uniref:Peptidase inhibitor family I36 n=1 Tax=Amycolatopsis arida TaxID=587909 RepID=A0A1I5TXY7_9PSEU|nr:peptidase inhibitor family I36 protein [Amycolatopsis arida]TDX95946.1 peptidase inhibitor family I36 [Amycolatopsis arida]SFP87166.1 Peptidase inhibitor family I36 [Amycolatopsis arida]
MRRGIRIAAKGLVAAGVAAAAIVVPQGAASAAPSCTSDLCLWFGTNYTGTKTTAGYFDKNTHCYFDGHYNSAISRTGYRIRMYSGSNCNGPSFILSPGQKLPRTKFVVHSFKRA